MTLKSFGVDIDTKDKKTISIYKNRMQQIGFITQEYFTAHGKHFRVRLPKPLSFKEVIMLRYFCGDDPRRMIKDVIKVWSGSKDIDLLFTSKWKGWVKK